ncbi:hypothetical protein EWM63_04390 [Pseudoduganella lutea]|uniref:Uncharacterized protein n=1 Tax=Pseudoduganella lutea TaxID=321985 RepID=A0A4P6KUK2_9BURK|nr:hypothetical protein EWM63_04390 [Pseudoduganella lutea]
MRGRAASRRGGAGRRGARACRCRGVGWRRRRIGRWRRHGIGRCRSRRCRFGRCRCRGRRRRGIGCRHRVLGLVASGKAQGRDGCQQDGVFHGVSSLRVGPACTLNNRSSPICSRAHIQRRSGGCKTTAATENSSS